MVDENKHQPFDTWLFERDRLGADEQAALDAHLAECGPCRLLHKSWRGVETRLSAPGMIAPAPGFGQRWLERRTGELARHVRRRTWITLSVLLGIALAISPSMAIPLFESLDAPAQLGIGFLRAFSQFLTFVSALRNLVVVLTNALALVPNWFWLMGTLSLGSLAAVWTGLVYRLSQSKAQNGGF